MAAALASLRGLQPTQAESESGAAAAAAATAARRAKCTGLLHLSGMIRRPAGLRLASELRVPQHAFPALSDADADVRIAALELFLHIAALPQLGGGGGGGSGGGEGGGEGEGDATSSTTASSEAAATAEAARTLYGCFGHHAMMAALTRPLHDSSEPKTTRLLSVELMRHLALSDVPLVPLIAIDCH